MNFITFSNFRNNKWLGHVDIKTTQIYARADVSLKRSALESANVIETNPKVSRGYEDKSYNLFVYDGQNYSIKNLRGNGGLFGMLAASTIKNVYIDGASISSDFENSGILVNEITSYSFDAINGSETYSTGNSQIQNCRAANSAIYTDGTVKNVGGICGYGGSIESCTADNISIRGGEAAGCIVGNACTVKGCLSRGNSIEGGAEISGGIAGTAFGVELHERGDRVRKVGGEITGCGVVSFASTNADYCGGVAGLTSGISYDSYIRGCYAVNIYLSSKSAEELISKHKITICL